MTATEWLVHIVKIVESIFMLLVSYSISVIVYKNFSAYKVFAHWLRHIKASWGKQSSNSASIYVLIFVVYLLYQISLLFYDYSQNYKNFWYIFYYSSWWFFCAFKCSFALTFICSILKVQQVFRGDLRLRSKKAYNFAHFWGVNCTLFTAQSILFST